MLVTWELPKIFLQIWFISSLIDFLEPAKTRGWALFLDPCNLSTEDVQWTTGLILWLWECSGRLTKKQTKSQLPSLEHLLEKPGLSYHGAWKLQKHCWTSPTHLKTPFSMIECSLLSRDLWNPQELATAGQRFLLLYVSLSSDSDPEEMFWRFKPKHHLFQELCEFDECCPS